jgi:hypothetical protein
VDWGSQHYTVSLLKVLIYHLHVVLNPAYPRFQALWARKYVLRIPPLGNRRERKGFFISVGGRKVPNLFDGALVVVKTFFRIIDVTYAGELLFSGVDEKGAVAQRPDALKQAFEAGQRFV